MESLLTFGTPLFASLAKGFGLGLLAALVLLVVVRKLGWLQRNGGFRKVLTCCWYLYLPLLLGSVGAVWCAADSMVRMQAAVLDPIRAEVTAASTQAAEDLLAYLRTQLPVDPELLTRELVQNIVADYVDNELLKGLMQDKRLPSLAHIALQGLRQPVILVVMDYLTDSLVKKIAAASSLEAEDVRAVWDKGIVHAMRQGLVIKLVEQNMNKRFVALRDSSLKMGGVLLLPVLLEVGTAMYARRRRKDAGGAASVQNF